MKQLKPVLMIALAIMAFCACAHKHAQETPRSGEKITFIKSDKESLPPIVYASKTGDIATVKNLIQAGTDVNVKDNEGKTALMYAKDQKAAKLLLKNGADVNAKDDWGITPLLYASGKGNADVVKQLLQNGADIHVKDKKGWPAFFWAVQGIYEYSETLQEAKNENEENSIDVSWSKRQNSPDAAKLLLENGADINAKDNEGKTALMYASNLGYADMVKFLLENGADVNAKDGYNQTALIHAMDVGYISSALLDDDGFHLQIGFYDGGGDPDVVNLLLKNGADVNAKDKHGQTALMWAAGNYSTDIVKLLLENGADINAKNNDGKTVFMYAANGGLLISENLPDMVEVLLQYGADINAKDNEGKTALMEVAGKDKEWENLADNVRLLLKLGADVNAKDNKGKTALTYAKQAGNNDIVKLLKEAGSKK